MDYFKAFETIKTALEKTDISPTDGHFAIQVRITDEDCGGIFYIESKDKQLFIEPYDYYDNDVDVAASFKDFENIAKGSLDAKKAAEDGKIFISGNAEGFFAVMTGIKPVKSAKEKVAKKTPAKKTAEKKSEKTTKKTAKISEKKTSKTEKASPKAEKKEAVKMAEETKKSPEKNESIADVVKKETKPEKKTNK